MAYNDEPKKSVFNAGVAQANRIDFLQNLINLARLNPLGIDDATGKFNYEIMISSNDALLNESWGKLTDDERTKGIEIKGIIHECIKRFPIFFYSTNKLKINNTNYEKFLDLIDLYERINKDFLEAHDLNSPSKGENDDEL